MTGPFKMCVLAGMLLIGCAGFSSASSDLSKAATNAVAASATTNDAPRTKALLDRAVADYQKNPRWALVDFSMLVHTSTVTSMSTRLAKTV